MENSEKNNASKAKTPNGAPSEQAPALPDKDETSFEAPSISLPKRVHAICMRDCMAVLDGSGESRFVRQGERVQIMTDAPCFCHFAELGDVKA